MNGLKEDFSKLKGNIVFNKWKGSHKDVFFSYAFNTVEEQSMGKWQFGFYDKGSHKVTSFIVDGDVIQAVGEDDVFAADEKDILETTVDSVKVPLLEMFDRMMEFIAKEYPNDTVGKMILVLQNIPKIGNVWNVTLVTKSMNTINLKIDPSNGKIISHKMVPLFDFKKA